VTHYYLDYNDPVYVACIEKCCNYAEVDLVSDKAELFGFLS
jgi:hypothetical protein